MAADKCKKNEGSLTGEDLEIFRTEYVDKEIERIYPNLSPHLPRKQKLHLNVFNGEDLEIAIDRATQWQKEQMMANATEVTVHIDAGGYPYTPEIELYDYDKDVPLAKEGDKYKVILIKED